MHFFDVDAATTELRRERVSDKQMRKYLLPYFLMLGIYLGIYYAFFYWNNPDRPWFTIFELFWLGLSALAWIGCFMIHGRGDFGLFVKRMICLGVPVGFCTLLYVIPAPIFTLVVMRFFVGEMLFKTMLGFGLPLIAVMVYMYLYFTYYSMMLGHMRKIAE